MTEGEVSFNPSLVKDPGPNRKYSIGDRTSHWGEADEFNESYLHAVEMGFILKDGTLTEAGVTELERIDTESRLAMTHTRSMNVSLHEPDSRRSSSEIVDPDSGDLGIEKQTRTGFRTSASARLEARVDQELVDKELTDQIHEMLEKRGYNVTGIELHEDSGEPRGERRFILTIKFKSGPDKKGGGKVRNLKLVGSHGDLVHEIAHADLNLPTTIRPERSRRARRPRP